MATQPAAPTRPSVNPGNRSRTGLPALSAALAVLGVVFLVWQVWTLTAWLCDGPHQITQFRDSNSASFWAARVFEVGAVIVSLVVIRYVIQDCRRAGKLTFDAKLVLASFSVAWFDPMVNAMAPVWFYSSNWVNLNAWSGHMPFIINPDAGRLPEPVLFIAPIYLGAIPLFIFAINRGMGLAQRRYPDISLGKLTACAFAGAALCDFVLETEMYYLRLFAAPGTPSVLSVTGAGATRYSAVEVLAAAFIFTGLAMARWFKDDRGRSLLVEQYPATRSPFRAQMVSILALIGLAHGLVFVGDAAIVMQGFYASPYDKMPAHLVNEMCDAPGFAGTVYGPCPGTPGFRMPVRKLPER